ncbi:MAG: DUF928 domain-containing protein [Jaaginema sp. PMC 1079.18]|nr:DUF928 domain-containing protein [Jaaginema sp. PMC 1080.18]MEC4849989.1 DUF928 domain-containing protein [Jaaginema sp. PMC 1079.18]MEC4865181.1 DUF928 domain-containing protein [Jaaginema sp. PMC 1078.18]
MKKVILKFGLATCLFLANAAYPAFAEQTNDNRGAFPGRRVGGGTRSEQCLGPDLAMTALNPNSNLGVTAKSNPTIYFAIPALAQVRDAEFVLTDSQGKTVYSTVMTVGKMPQLASIQLPENAIATGQDYQWSFSLMCDPQDYTRDIILTGWLRRVAGEAEQIPHNLEGAIALQDQELWLDAIAMLIDLRQAQPQNREIEQKWQQTLQELDLNLAPNPMTISQF